MGAYLIITADDYGMCESVNHAIEECLIAGAMRSTCVMPNMPLWREAAQLRRRFPEASIGLHWTLTMGEPILPPSAVSTLVDDRGVLLPFGAMRRRWLRRQVDPAQVEAELTAQYVRLRDVAGEPDYWNTHENIHVTPGLFQLCVRLGQRLGIPAMRCQRRVIAPQLGGAALYNLGHPAYWLKGQVISAWSSRAERDGVLMPDGAIHMPGYRAGDSSVEEALGRVRWPELRRAAELIIHPATQLEPELFGNLTESRLRDYTAFSDPALRERLLARGIRPAGFEVLRGAA